MAIGFGSPDGFTTRLQAFRRGLAEEGYREGENVSVEYRWADGQNDRLQALAADLVSHHAAVIATPSSANAAKAVKSVTQTTSIVFETGLDPLAAGLVTSMSHPTENVTGVSSLNVAAGQKRLEIVRQLVPNARVVGILINPSNISTETTLKDLRLASKAVGLELRIQFAGKENELDHALSSLAGSVDALIVAPDPFFIGKSKQIIDLSMRQRLATLFFSRDFVVAGALASYGGSVAESHRQAGIYVGRILNGAKVADLPVQQITKFELVINLKTAKNLGIAISPTLSALADEVIE